MEPLTIFTPAYNRAEELKATYESLRCQSVKNFIWLVIDDGSSDDTAELVDGWKKSEDGFEIRYAYKENGGIHTAYNLAYRVIDTEINMCINPGELLEEGAVKAILERWSLIRYRGYAGIMALAADGEGNVLGNEFPDWLAETTVTGYYALGGRGEKKLIYRSDITRQYPEYPVFEGEKYVSLAYKSRLIDEDYSMNVMNRSISRMKNFSESMYRAYVDSPKGFAFWRRVCMINPESRQSLFVDCINYVAGCMLGKERNIVSGSPRKLLTILALPLGAMYKGYILKRACEA